MSDLIDRQAAIDALRVAYWDDNIQSAKDDPCIVDAMTDWAIRQVKALPPAQPESLVNESRPLVKDTISRQAAIDRINGTAYAEQIKENMIFILRMLPSAQPEIIRCKDCKYWVPGYITDNDDFIPPKCGEWQQMVGHSSDDYCSLAERREVTT